jgi:site-specific recombinase XerC
MEALTAEHIKALLMYAQGLRQAVNGSRALSKGAPSSLTVHSHAQVINTFCGWLVRNGYAEQNTAQGVAAPKVERYITQAPLTPTENRSVSAPVAFA